MAAANSTSSNRRKDRGDEWSKTLGVATACTSSVDWSMKVGIQELNLFFNLNLRGRFCTSPAPGILYGQALGPRVC